MRTLIVGAALLVGLLSCGRGDANPRPDTLTRRQRDSMLGASQLPGAQGVRGALLATDSAAARRAREETVTPEP